MTRITSDQRMALRQRLMALALSEKTTPEESLADQIDHLLEEVLEDEPLTLPRLAPVDAYSEDQRVVVTGLGLVTPFGMGIDPFWTGLKEGRSAIRRITLCDPSDFPCQIAGEVPGFDPRPYMDFKESRRMSRASQLAVAAARMALEDANLQIDESNRYTTGAVIGSGSTALPETEEAVRAMIQKGPMKISPFFIPSALPNMPSCQVAIQLGLYGYNTAICTACAAGAQSIGEAVAVIRRGDAHIMLAGGTEAAISRLGLGSFCAMRALSSQNAEPERASRPFDVGRDGFVPSEGAAVLVLERLSDARRRRAPIYAEVLGYGSTCDAHHVTAPDPQGNGAARAMRLALGNARLGPQQVDYINAHATSTPAGDIAETLAIKQVFDEYAYSVPISATKSMIGHATSAGGAIEAAATLLALKHGLIPPTINLDNPDPVCDLDYVPHTSRVADLQIVMSNSFGFGGVNAVLVFQQIDAT